VTGLLAELGSHAGAGSLAEVSTVLRWSCSPDLMAPGRNSRVRTSTR
jgi:hypothetical protein